MKKLLWIVPFLISMPANAEITVLPYASAKAVYSNEKTNIKTSQTVNVGDVTLDVAGVNGALGLQMGLLRTEFEFGYRNKKKSTITNPYGTYENESRFKMYQLNAYFDIPTGTIFRPYVGAGVGAGTMDILYANDALPEKNDTRFLWNLQAGIGVRVMEDLYFDVGYKYMRIEDAEFSYKIGATAYSEKRSTDFNEVSIGFRWLF